jgi:hypothetical protein
MDTTPPRKDDGATEVQPTIPPPASPSASGVDGPQDPSVPDAAVETTVTAEPVGSRPEAEPVVPTAEPESVKPAEPVRPELSQPQSAEPQPAAPAREVVYVAAPIPPKPKGNRGIGVLLALLSAVLFLVLYALFALLIRAVTGGPVTLEFLRDGSFYIPALLFAVAFVVLALLVNRAGWWSFVFGSLFVGVFVYLGTIVALLLLNAADLTPAAADLRFRQLLINPLAIAAGLVAREVALWVGAGISARGRRVKAKNAERLAEFEREQEARRGEFERNGVVVRPA